MEDQSIKVRRTTIAIKFAMVFIILNETIAFYQTDVLDFGAIAMSAGLLALLRGLLLSPIMLNGSVKSWFKKNVGFSSDSHKYFALALVLISVGLIR